MKINVKIIGRRKTGWFSEGIEEQSVESSVCGVSLLGGNLETYAKDAQDETPVYDAKDADNDAFTSFLREGPTLDVRAKDEPLKEHYSVFDMVSINTYLALLRKVPGVRFGKVMNGEVIWE